MAKTDVGVRDLCQTISDAHSCCDGIQVPPQPNLPTLAATCGGRTFRSAEYVSTYRTHLGPRVGVA